MSAKLINVVLDLETLSASEDAAIIQIGACVPKFDWPHLPQVALHPWFLSTVRYEECLDKVRDGTFKQDSGTMSWWEKQPTRAQVFSGQDSYADALESFVEWLAYLRGDEVDRDVVIWGNGSDFDNRLLAYTFSAFGYEPQWSFRNNRDLRTLKALFPLEIEADPGEIKHTALGDARYEARLLDAIQRTHKLETL